MHAYGLLELAALVAVHGPLLVRGVDRLAEGSLEAYWVASKSRLDRWGRMLKAIATAASQPDARLGASPLVRAVLEEIVTGEMLTRIWAAVMCAYDRQHHSGEAEPIARSVLIGHLEARHRVLTLLVRGCGFDAEQAVKLNLLRRRAERWTDLLLGRLAGVCDAERFAFDPQRTRDFAEDLGFQESLTGGCHAWPLVVASLRAAFQQGLSPASPNADLNAQIAESILAAFPPSLFDSTGLLHSLWMLRVTSVADDAQGMLDVLLSDKSPPPQAPEGLPGQLANRLRRFGR